MIFARILLVLFMGVSGILHFVAPIPYSQMIPKWLPYPIALVYISGAAELMGAIGLCVPSLRRWAGVWIILLLIAIFPANINMAVNQIQPADWHMPGYALWLRLPFQFVFMWWAWRVSRR
jgi:uncharacterized membrane protein